MANFEGLVRCYFFVIVPFAMACVLRAKPTLSRADTTDDYNTEDIRVKTCAFKVL
jgi:hypothetical protein